MRQIHHTIASLVLRMLAGIGAGLSLGATALGAPIGESSLVWLMATDAFDRNDYVDFSGTLNFAPGETVKTVRVQLVNDIVAEGTEVLRFNLRSPTNATISRTSADVTILDDDNDRPLLSFGRSDDVYTIDSAAVTFNEATDGGFDVVRSSVSFTLPAVLEGVILTGSAANATGNAKANFFQGNALANTINGLEGIDTMAIPGRDGDYGISGSVAGRTVSGPATGTDTLLSIERLRFDNTLIAYDTEPGGNTYAAYALLRAALDAAPSPQMLGQWTAQVDQLGSLREAARALIQFYAPGVSNEVLVSHIWSTIVGGVIAPADLVSFTALIDNGTFTQASLLEAASLHPLNTIEFAAVVGQPLSLDPAWFPLPGG